VGIAKARNETRVAEQKKLTTGKAALLLVLSALGAIASATLLHGWYVYVGFAIVGVGILIGFLRWNRKS
jgi:UDP-N-acetylmuramyl pentapeptide phosphotransferase/UDP-N-acetylglucosamine-1-phosphate transferase